jgi:hypothetical protein
MNKRTNLAKPKQIYFHLVSDATGTTLQGLARACLAQFDNVDPVERFWPLVRTERQLERVMEDISDYPGPVLYTLMDPNLRKKLDRHCKALNIPCMAVMDPLIKGFSSYLGQVPAGVPGLQHVLDEAYFHRVDAVDFALTYDDGQNTEGIEDADVILVGVSRTSKTPTCIFLARRGIKAANIPYVPGVPFPHKIEDLTGPLIVGLTESPDRLVNLRRTRLKTDENDKHHGNNTYLDPDKVSDEIREARRYFSKNGWPVIDVTKRSIEETAAEVQMLLQKRNRKFTEQGYE